MKSKAELEMERTQARVRRLKRELEEAHKEADIAWRAYVSEETRRPVAESSNSGMNDSQSHQPSMTSEQLDRFQDWLNREAVEANNKSGAYFNGRACAFNDAFECLTILRMKASQTPESTESDKSPSATEATN